ncbi:o-succinylbenzoate--CoA ligase [Luteimicrobium xylanilyticum]|uniref:O-succinylbenzoate--CoA ligase n=1 Tax=Luteimicrobium xylanilyticum TaxID=1133546 RepID=A0A5P9Q710_9MICO|nr:AMP-binding protein [Luteimicrobium xylanilyticum]QFU97207.1 o-succinylbenzoate--CoA ligase [Luteimicrobium xylanilyticum]
MPRVVVPRSAADLYAALARALTADDGATVALQPLAHDEEGLPAGAALVVRTSGSTGAPREVVLTRTALLASIAATAARLGGHGRWLLALPWHHVAGAQVVARSVVAGTVPAHLPDAAFTPALLAEHATRFLDDPATGRAYVSLVPTQLHRVVEAATTGDGDGLAAARALARFDAVLLGGAASSPDLLDAARSLGVPVVTTYGMSETCGGCVYDGVPLDGVHVRLGEDGRVELGGPVVAAGYLGEPGSPAFRADADGTRWFLTSDLGSLTPLPDDGAAPSGRPRARLRVLGRADDVVVTGGEKVAPLTVEHALAPLGETCVVGVPDPEWGQAVVAVVVRPTARGGAGGRVEPAVLAPADDDLRDRARALAREALGPHAAPRHVLVTTALPLRGPGKVDRRGLATLADAVVRGEQR